LCGEQKDKSKWGGSKNIYKRDITESGGKGYPLADFPCEGGVSLINKSSFHKSFF